jgi:hypothetical protein
VYVEIKKKDAKDFTKNDTLGPIARKTIKDIQIDNFTDFYT